MYITLRWGLVRVSKVNTWAKLSCGKMIQFISYKDTSVNCIKPYPKYCLPKDDLPSDLSCNLNSYTSSFPKLTSQAFCVLQFDCLYQRIP